MSYSSLERHSNKAASHVKFADKAPDYFLAATEMHEAAQAFQLAKMDAEAKAAYIRSAELRLKDNDHQSAARCYDQASEFEKAAECYMICGGIDQAVRSVLRSKDTKCFEKAINLYAQDESKDILASDVYKQYITKLVAGKEFENFFGVSDKYISLLIRIEQWPFVYKEILSQVIIKVSLGELVGADRILANHLNTNSFVHSQEYAAADDLITAIRENDSDNLKKIQSSPTVLYVNTEVVKIAKTIKTAESRPNEVDALLM